MLCHWAGGDDAMNARRLRSDQAIKGILEDEGFGGADLESFGRKEEETGVRFDLTCVIDGGEVVKVIN